MARLLKGAEVTADINEKLKQDVEVLKGKGIAPTLAIVRMGKREDDISYEKGAMKRCDMVGVGVKNYILDGEATQQELLDVIHSINGDAAIHGVLIFRPLPKHIDDDAVKAALLPEKDIDCVTDGSLAGVFSGTNLGYPPCTAQACIEILDHFGIDVKGKNVVVVGRSLVVGKPVAMMLLKKHATVTICHTRTVDMPGICRKADILIVAAGKAGVVNETYVAPGQIVIDVGINFNEATGKLCGDVKFDSVEPVVEAITPVPGGVGTVTTSVLVKHVVDAAMKLA